MKSKIICIAIVYTSFALTCSRREEGAFLRQMRLFVLKMNELFTHKQEEDNTSPSKKVRTNTNSAEETTTNRQESALNESITSINERNFRQKRALAAHEQPLKVCKCRRAPHGIGMMNKKTGEIHPIRCKAYICDDCRGLKIHKLTNAIINFLKPHKYIRLFTFTVQNSDADDKVEFAKKFGIAWRHFMRNLRRSQFLSQEQRKVPFIRAVEYTKREYAHYHVFFTKYLPIHLLNEFWHAAVRYAYKDNRKSTINIKTSYHAEKAAKYVAKYVVKSCKFSREFEFNFRRYSASGGVKLFEEVAKSDDWCVVRILNSSANSYLHSVTAHDNDTPRRQDMFEFLEMQGVWDDVQNFYRGFLRNSQEDNTYLDLIINNNDL